MPEESQKPGPDPDRLKIGGDWADAVKKGPAQRKAPFGTGEASGRAEQGKAKAEAMTRRKAFFRLWAFFAALLFVVSNVAHITNGTITSRYSGLMSGYWPAMAGSAVGMLIGYSVPSAALAALAILAVKNPPKAD